MLAPLLLLALVAQTPDRPAGPLPDKFTPDPAWKALDKTNALFFDPAEKRLILRARVCLREGYLEHLMCIERSKEHESILATYATPRLIHAGLILTGAEPGHPVRYRPEFQPPAGTPIEITLEWTEDGKKKTANARDWVRDSKTKKTLAEDWVFAGSSLFPDPDNKSKTIYAADGGDLFTVANFTSAILDVPFSSSGNDAERSFMANTDKIPPKDTYLTLILRPAKAKPAAKP